MKAKNTHTFLTAILLSWIAVFSLPAFAYNVGDQIFANTKEGIKLRFTITSLSPKECEVGNYGRDVSGVLTIPENVEGFSITKIADGGFSGCRYLTSIIIPKSVKSFSHSAFDYCLSLTSITIPNSVTNIGEYAFYKCISLTSIDIPNSVTSIGNSAFYRCTNLTSVTIPNSVTSIGWSAFRECISLKEVRSKIKSPFTISEGAFTTGFSFDEETGVQVEVLTSATLYVPKGTKEQYLVTGGWKNFNKIENHNNIVEIEYEAAGKITFVDPEVKKICIRNWDTSLDGKLSETEAAAVKDLGTVFKINKTIKSFNELKYFTGLTSIGEEAFSMCSGLTSITIPNSITTLENGAFSFCRGLTSITIPNSVTNIRNSVFLGCSGLTSVTIPNSVTSIRDGAFKDCGSLTSVYISDLEAWCKISFINEYSNPLYYAHHLYLNGEEIKQLVIPNSVTSIGSIAFGGCSTLTSVTIPNSVTSIGSYAFYECSGLTSITIPSSVTSIEDGVFLRCTGLTSITIPNSVTSIGWHAFRDCSGLTSVNIPNSVTSIGKYAFADCSSLQEVHSLIEQPFAISENVFSTYDATTLYVPAGTKTHYQATAGWKNFTSIVEMEAPVKNITFTDAEVKRICVQNWDTNGDGELSEDEAATVKDLGEVFKENPKIKSFNELKYFTGLKTIGDYAFFGCSNLTAITIPNSVTKIDKQAISYCWSLTTITIPNSVTNIGNYAFSGCLSLTSISIPPSVKSIGEGAFLECKGITSIVVEEGNPVYDSRNNCNAIINTSNNKLITGCKNTIIPSSVTSIDGYAFTYCSGLTSITIPNSVTNIGSYAFSYCTDLQEVHSLIVQPFSIDKHAFQLNNGSFTTATLYVPAGTKTQYQATDGWKNFANIVEEGGETPVPSRDWTDLTADMFKAWDGAGKNAKVVNDPAPCPNEDGTTSNFETSFALNQELGSGETVFGHLSVYYLWYADLTGAQTITIEGTAGLQIRVLMNRAAPTADDTDPHGGEMTEYKLIIEDNGKAELDVSSLEFVHLNAIKTDWNSPSGMITKIQYSTEGGETTKSITFTDAEVKRLCVQNWDTNGDGELSENEAAAVKDLGEVFKNNQTIKSFNELQYFTGLTTIGNYAFFSCYNLTAITIPNSVTYIDSQAFGYCRSLTAIIIPNSVTRIESNAFNSCSSLTSITIPNSVTRIGGNAFWECASITSIVVEGGNPAYDSRNNCNAIINTSNNELITGCKTTIIPNSVTSIGVSAFYGCSGLTSITIPNNVTSIERYAFRDCTGLQEVHSQIQQPFAISENVFSTYDATTLYVPAGTKAKYQATEGWKNFANIVEEGGDPDDVTLTAKSYTREYGEENPTFGYEVTSGTITSGQPTLSCTATKTSPVGTYDIVIQTGTVSNGTVNLVKGTLTITKAPLTISAGSYTKEEGQDNPEFTLNYTGFKNGETKSVLTKQPTVSCNATKNSPAGTYTVTVSGAEAQNYNISYVNGSLTITPKPVVSKNITFADAEVKRICVQNWDTNGDGELSEAEAAAVTDLGNVFKDNKTIRTFHELHYFTNLNSIKDYAFQGCSNLTEMTIPAIITSVGENAFNDAGLLSLIWESNTSLTAKQVERLKEARPNILIFVKDEDVMPSKGIDNVVINGVAESLVLTENSPFHSIQTFTAQSATFSHRFTMETGKGASAGWETIALPFDVQVYRHETKGEVVPFAKYTEGSKAKPFWLYRLTSGGFVEAQAIEANKPYLISMPNNAAYYDEDCLNGKVQFTASSVTIKRTDEAEMTNVSYEGKMLRPTFAAVDRSSTVYAINATGDFSTATGGGTAGSLFVRDLRAVRPFEAYFDSGSANAREFITINFADETATGIDSTFDVPRSMVNGQRSMVNVYNMAGQLVYSGSTEGLNAMKQQLPAGLYVVSSANGVSRVRAY